MTLTRSYYADIKTWFPFLNLLPWQLPKLADSSGGLGQRFFGPFKALSLSPSWGAKPSVDACSLTVPLTSPLANFTATLLLRVLFPPPTLDLILGVAYTAGRSVLSINRETWCLKRWKRNYFRSAGFTWVLKIPIIRRLGSQLRLPRTCIRSFPNETLQGMCHWNNSPHRN